MSIAGTKRDKKAGDRAGRKWQLYGKRRAGKLTYRGKTFIIPYGEIFSIAPEGVPQTQERRV